MPPTTRRKTTAAQLEALTDRVDGAVERLSAIEAALVGGAPDGVSAAAAYDALRKQLLAAAGERKRLLVCLATLSAALAEDEPLETLRGRLEEWAAQAGLHEVRDTDDLSRFDVVGDGPDVRVVRPAWVDGTTGALIQRGVAERTEAGQA
ncbi:hypothetical protein [Motilibacter aurantiacus]|uniref:hypothetical protein n=1 Tax=Motilibacter aurantiacus TaxID=2714955 RepID=UPI00140757CF|nr:hypothetical protein [Motilibacter aurantiacus]NHC45623.1 hypothetical protein [Motilibacter aurantiacus]